MRTRHTQRGAPAQALPESVASALMAFVSPVCFDKACQQAADQTTVTAFVVPMLLALAAAFYVVRPPPKTLVDEGRVFEDDATGAVFEAPRGVEPLRDKQGELVLRPVSYTPWPVGVGEEGEVVRVRVGPVRDTQPRSFLFRRLLPGPSALVTVTLPRPLGVVLEYDEAGRRAVVVDTIEGTAADRARKRAALSSDQAVAALPGDILRAVTCTNFVYPTQALFGARPPERHIVLYGADNQTWAKVCGALKKGDVKDGEVTMVLERPQR